MIERLAVIGCGLMGGSFARALRQRGLVSHISGYSPSASTRDLALSMGVIDEACDSVSQAVKQADVVLLSVPVQASIDALRAMAVHLGEHVLLMDVGSTKSDVIAAARSTLGQALPRFVPAHPIAGKEVAGVRHADADLYLNRQVFLTPMSETDPSLTARAHSIWQALGSKVGVLTPDVHDQTFAAVSHLPHLLAFAYINGLTRQDQGERIMSMGGPGFKDFSRIAASDPTVWRDILLANREQVLGQLSCTQQALSELIHAMQTGDGQRLSQLIESSRQARSNWRMAGAADQD
jgi:prephenate dehydrogenase